MAAKIGILAESTTTTVATTTVYTVPADKAARIRLIFAVKGGGSGIVFGVLIGSPGVHKQLLRELGSSSYMYSGMPASATQLITAQGMYVESVGDYTAAGGNRYAVTPWPFDFYLSTGDTVRTFIATDTSDLILFQVIGVEDDA